MSSVSTPTLRRSATHPPALAVDLDGTLLVTDTLLELALTGIRRSPWMIILFFVWLVQGRAVLKHELARRFSLEPALLPYHESFVNWLRNEFVGGRHIVLATAADRRIAQTIADHLGLFREVFASDGHVNLKGSLKAKQLEARFGQKGFAYAGNSIDDMPVWRTAAAAVLVNAPSRLVHGVARSCPIEGIFPPRHSGLGRFARLFRLHQWLKNLLLLVPIMAAHKAADLERWPGLLLGLVAFCFCGSAVYIVNDLFDLEADRHHRNKRRRPLASGAISLWCAIFLAPTFLASAVLIGAFAPPPLLDWLAIYFFVTCIYSLAVKRMAYFDCFTLAFLYTLRVEAGGAAANVAVSTWLICFSLFLFLSLALLKRYAEISKHDASYTLVIPGRGYRVKDARRVASLGICAAFGAVLVLLLYINSETVAQLYGHPQYLWLTLPVLSLWLGHMWHTVQRGAMHDDPLMFAVTDMTSVISGLLLVAILTAGALGIPW